MSLIQVSFYFFYSKEHKGKLYQQARRLGLKHFQIYGGIGLQYNEKSTAYIEKLIKLERIDENDFTILSPYLLEELE